MAKVRLKDFMALKDRARTQAAQWDAPFTPFADHGKIFTLITAGRWEKQQVTIPECYIYIESHQIVFKRGLN